MKNIKRQICEVYSRVCGYMRPVSNWNDSKQAEYHARVNFVIDKKDLKD
jgi:ribonucleoside-triphosphate reductase (formate)